MHRYSHLFLASLLASAPAWAGITVVATSGKRQSTLRSEGHFLRVEQQSPEGSQSMIVDGTARSLTVLNAKNKTFRRMEMDRLETSSAQAGQKVEEALARMPPVQRERVASALRNSGQGGSGLTSPVGDPLAGQVQFTPLGKQDQVAGYPCEWYRAQLAGRLLSETCYVSYGALGATREDFTAVLKTMNFLRVLGARMGRAETPDPGWEKAPGFPGIRVPFSPTGERRDEERLVRFERGPVPSDLLSVPADYQPTGQSQAATPQLAR